MLVEIGRSPVQIRVFGLFFIFSLGNIFLFYENSIFFFLISYEWGLGINILREMEIDILSWGGDRDVEGD